MVSGADKLRSPRPPAMSGGGGFTFGLSESNGRPKIFEKSVQPSSRDLCKEYGIEIHDDPTTVSSLTKNKKKESNSSDEEEGTDTRTSKVWRRREAGTASEMTSGETSESEAHDTLFARTHSATRVRMGGRSRWRRGRARAPRSQRCWEWSSLTPHAHGAWAFPRAAQVADIAKQWDRNTGRPPGIVANKSFSHRGYEFEYGTPGCCVRGAARSHAVAPVLPRRRPAADATFALAHARHHRTHLFAAWKRGGGGAASPRVDALAKWSMYLLPALPFSAPR